MKMHISKKALILPTQLMQTLPKWTKDFEKLTWWLIGNIGNTKVVVKCVCIDSIYLKSNLELKFHGLG